MNGLPKKKRERAMYDPMNIKALTLDLGGRWMRSYGTAPCPVCQPERRKRQNALTIAERGGRLLMHCKKSGCDFRDLLAASGIAPGRVEIDLAALERVKRARIEADAKAQRQAQRQAQSLWRKGQPITGTHGETYLRGRRIVSDMPESLRWLPETYHKPSQQSCAAMLAQVRSVTGEPMGLHRTFFTRQGERLSQSPKMMLGPCRGGAVRLFEAEGPLVVAEGIETALSLACGLLSGTASIWAALSTSGLAGLELPPCPGKLTIAPDGDDAGKSAANRLAERATALGWEVSLLPAPNGMDWNDVLRKGRAT